MIDPPCWDAERLEAERATSIEAFRKARLEEPVDAYAREVERQRLIVRDLLSRAADLREMDNQRLCAILADARFRDAFRYLAGPPVSDDDWKTLADVASLSPAALAEDPAAVQRLVEVVISAIDASRFPWLAEGSEPTEPQRHAAVLASACLWAHQRTQTLRRSAGKRNLEEATRTTLRSSGLSEHPARDVSLLRDAPAPGAFCGECSIAGRRADFAVGLWDGRHALIECKDSNSYVNSIKRLNNDTAAKAVYWVRTFGERSVVPLAVISGVYYLDSLARAQADGLRLFWAHDMPELSAWLDRVRSATEA